MGEQRRQADAAARNGLAAGDVDARGGSVAAGAVGEGIGHGGHPAAGGAHRDGVILVGPAGCGDTARRTGRGIAPGFAHAADAGRHEQEVVEHGGAVQIGIVGGDDQADVDRSGHGNGVAAGVGDVPGNPVRGPVAGKGVADPLQAQPLGGGSPGLGGRVLGDGPIGGTVLKPGALGGSDDHHRVAAVAGQALADHDAGLGPVVGVFDRLDLDVDGEVAALAALVQISEIVAGVPDVHAAAFHRQLAVDDGGIVGRGVAADVGNRPLGIDGKAAETVGFAAQGAVLAGRGFQVGFVEVFGADRVAVDRLPVGDGDVSHAGPAGRGWVDHGGSGGDGGGLVVVAGEQPAAGRIGVGVDHGDDKGVGLLAALTGPEIQGMVADGDVGAVAAVLDVAVPGPGVVGALGDGADIGPVDPPEGGVAAAGTRGVHRPDPDAVLAAGGEVDRIVGARAVGGGPGAAGNGEEVAGSVVTGNSALHLPLPGVGSAHGGVVLGLDVGAGGGDVGQSRRGDPLKQKKTEHERQRGKENSSRQNQISS